MKKTFFIDGQSISLRAGMSLYLKANSGFIIKVRIAKIQDGFIYSRDKRWKTDAGLLPVVELDYFIRDGKYSPARVGVGEYHLPTKDIVREYEFQEAKSVILSYCSNLEYYSIGNQDFVISLSKTIIKNLSKANEKRVQE